MRDLVDISALPANHGDAARHTLLGGGGARLDRELAATSRRRDEPQLKRAGSIELTACSMADAMQFGFLLDGSGLLSVGYRTAEALWTELL